MITLIIDGASVAIKGDSKQTAVVESLIAPCMSFQPINYQYSEKYKAGEWSGWIELYDNYQHRFPRGFLDEVEMILGLSDIEYQVEDRSIYGTKNPLFIETDHNKLRPYQVDAVNKAVDAQRGILCMPTGTGKTFTAIEIMRRVGYNTVVFVHKLELMEQWTEVLMKELGLPRDDIGRVGDGEIVIRPITIAMVQTVSRLPPQVFNSFGVGIIDECHHVPADTVFDLATSFRGAHLYGLSATPFRTDGMDLKIKGALGSFIINLNLSEMIEAGWLARPTVYLYPVPPATYPRNASYADIYRDYIVENGKRNLMIRSIVEEHFKAGKSVYVHVRHLAHGRHLKELLPDAVWINGQDKLEERTLAIKNFSEKGGVLISDLLGEGIDVPGMDCLVLACGGLSEVFVRQLIGRVLRVTANKKTVEIVDFKDCCKYLVEHAEAREALYFSEPAFKMVNL